MMKTICAGILTVLTLAWTTVRAADYVWNGGTGSWSDETMWTPTGVPDATHTVSIAGGEITLEADVTVKGLALSDTVTLSGAALTVSEPAIKAFSTAAGGTYTFNNKLVLVGTDLDTKAAFGGTIHFKGGLEMNTGGRINFGGGGVVHISDVPAKMKALIVAENTIHLDVANNYFTRIQLQGATATLHVNVDDAWQPDTFDYLYIFGNAKMHLHGHDVYVSPWAILGGNGDSVIQNVIDTEVGSPATFELKNTHANTDIRTNSTVDLTGPITFKQNANSTGTFALNRSISSTGSLIVEGGVFDLTAKGAWPNIASLEIGTSGRLRLAEGQAFVVPSLKLGGDEMPEGTYGSSDSNAAHVDAHFEGKGVVRVYKPTVGDPVTRVMVKDGALTDATCWEPAGSPRPDDTLILTDRTLRVDFPTTVTNLFLAGSCVLTGEPLTVAGPPCTSFTTAAGGTYVFSNKVVYAQGATTALGLWGTLYFAGGLDYPSYFTPAHNCEIHLQRVPVKFGKLTMQSATLYIEVPSNNFGRVQAQYADSKIHVLVDDPWLDSPWDYMYMVFGASLYLHGHYVHVPAWAILGSTTATSVGLIDSAEPATFAVSQTHTVTDIRTNSWMDVTGQVTFKMDSGSTTKFVLNRAITTTAGVAVEAGTFEFTSKASATNAATVAVSGVSATQKGRMIVNASKTFSRRAAVTLGANGTLELAAGTVNRVATLKIEGVDQPLGTYGATGSGAQFVDDVHFAGQGLLRVTGGGLIFYVR